MKIIVFADFFHGYEWIIGTRGSPQIRYLLCIISLNQCVSHDYIVTAILLDKRANIIL